MQTKIFKFPTHKTQIETRKIISLNLKLVKSKSKLIKHSLQLVIYNPLKATRNSQKKKKKKKKKNGIPNFISNWQNKFPTRKVTLQLIKRNLQLVNSVTYKK